MRIAYFDCFAGASGDMILGALVDAGFSLKTLQNELKKLDLHGYRLTAGKKEKNHITGTKFDVQIPKEHHHRTFKHIHDLIMQSDLSKSVKKTSVDIFTRLAEAEAKIHNKTIDDVHFHEVGAVDSIIDIVGAAIGFHSLGIDEIHVSRLPIGSGAIQCAHGVLPVPAPATLELLKGIPVYDTGIETELVTPTGAAILVTLSKGFGKCPNMTIHTTGYGLGSKDLDIPNLIRVIIGETTGETHQDRVQLIETNIDDMNPQFYDYVMDRLFTAGALDVFMTQVMMKKNRPGVVLSIIAPPQKIDALINILFEETTTLGIRISEVKKRKILVREHISVQTKLGEGRVKIRVMDNGQKIAEPEYEDCRKLAGENHVPVQTVYQTLKTEADRLIRK
ncbi:nickel pincer cofactor biosynthesis protein LarC [bacterium]|nr:nickel pincer cofactor biosynthesis protein LarC [bacterium]